MYTIPMRQAPQLLQNTSYWQFSVTPQFVPGPEDEWISLTLLPHLFFEHIYLHLKKAFPFVSTHFGEFKPEFIAGKKVGHLLQVEHGVKHFIFISDTGLFQFGWEVQKIETITIRPIVESVVRIFLFLKGYLNTELFVTNTPAITVTFSPKDSLTINLADLKEDAFLTYTVNKETLTHTSASTHTDRDYFTQNTKILIGDYTRTILDQLDGKNNYNWFPDIRKVYSKKDFEMLTELSTLILETIEDVETESNNFTTNSSAPPHPSAE